MGKETIKILTVLREKSSREGVGMMGDLRSEIALYATRPPTHRRRHHSIKTQGRRKVYKKITKRDRPYRQRA